MFKYSLSSEADNILVSALHYGVSLSYSDIETTVNYMKATVMTGCSALVKTGGLMCIAVGTALILVQDEQPMMDG